MTTERDLKTTEIYVSYGWTQWFLVCKCVCTSVNELWQGPVAALMKGASEFMAVPSSQL